MKSGSGRTDKAHFRGIAAARAVTCVRGCAYVGQSMESDCALLRPGHSVGVLFATLLEPRLDGGGPEEKGKGTRGAKRIGRDFNIVLLMNSPTFGRFRALLGLGLHPVGARHRQYVEGSSICRGLLDMSRIAGYVDDSAPCRGFLDMSRLPRYVEDSWRCR